MDERRRRRKKKRAMTDGYSLEKYTVNAIHSQVHIDSDKGAF